jgi:glycosyltransferase involved in cell wall biosynthesis
VAEVSGSLPLVTVVVPARNEERAIRTCLRTLLEQDYPRDRLEILVVDGASEDETRAIVAKAAAGTDVPIRLIENPRRTTPAALNRAIEAARGEFLVRVDGHSAPEPSYVRRVVEGNLEFRADLVGGWVEAIGTTPVGRAVAAALRSPFAMGYAVSWRPPAAAREVVSVPCGSYRLEALRRIGGFDEQQAANQDYEANYRLRREGGRVMLIPTVRLRYLTRPTLRSLARQFLRYGFYKARTMLKHPDSIRPRHVVPPAAMTLVTVLLALAWFAAPARVALAALAAAYVIAVLAASTVIGRGLGRNAFLLPLVFATMHTSWAAGNVAGLVRWLPTAPWRARSTPAA